MKHSPPLFPILCSGFLILGMPATALSHAGHGNEFKATGSTSPAGIEPAGIEVDAQIAQQMGIKVEAVSRRLMHEGIATTGKIEALPSQTVQVTSPISGTLIKLLVELGDTVAKGDAVAVLSSPELAALGVDADRQGAEGKADVMAAEAELHLARENYQQQVAIAEAEMAEAQTQLEAAQARFDRDRNLVNEGGVVAAARETYQQEVEVAKAEITQAETELTVAQERYDKDRELVDGGALPRRQLLESEAKLADAKAAFTRAKSRLSVMEAQTAVRQAEVDLPVRDLRESEDLLAQAKAQLTTANQRREVGEAEAAVKQAEAALQVAQARLALSDDTYAARLRQLGALPNPDGTVTITAPISGTVSEQKITLGESVDEAGEPLLRILDNHRVWVSASVYEKDIDRIEEGQSVIVRVESMGKRTFSGSIDRISPTVDLAERAIEVRAELDNSTGELKPGMFAQVEIATGQSQKPVISIVESAIVNTNGKQIVYVQNGQKFEAVDVTLGKKFGEFIEVTAGLFDGDRIVTQGGMLLYAQSLRSGGEHEHTEKNKHSADVSAVQRIAIPRTILLLGSAAVGAIALMSFWLGRRSHFRRDRIFQMPVEEVSTWEVEALKTESIECKADEEITPDRSSNVSNRF
jgi:membrane fusion protein, heavy metal efflux system